MNAEQVNAVGGWCELVGVVFLVRDLMSLARFREKPKEWAAWIKQWKGGVTDWWAGTPIMGWWRRLLGRQRHATFVEAGTATVTLTAHDVTQSSGMGTLTLSGQSLQDQIEELKRRSNELGKQLASEKQQREQAIAAEREARREEIRAEAEERERRIAEVERDVEKLRDVTTGDLGLKPRACCTWPRASS
jgi:DNA repair exonuclease SbcCD ATPase subunit